MKQVCFANGQIAILDVPAPACGPGGVLVRTSYSLISTGTETAMTAGGGGESLVVKAIKNPDLVRKVIERMGTAGVRQTLDLVRSRVQSSLALGYSAAGEIVEAGVGVTAFRPGDRVACAGTGYANHAEFNFVPIHLVAKVADSVPLSDAAFATLAAIALQGVRRLNPTLGEQVVVVGLGLIGQITAQLLKICGCQVFGVDLLPSRIDLARQLGMDEGLRPGESDSLAAIEAWTGGGGADGVVVCATGGDFGLLNRSFDYCRRKARVVLVGDVPIRIARDKIYKKELDFLISCSYGPGRYDKSYEEQGLDYPLSYVRWTEGRNLEEAVRLMGTGALRVAPLISRTYPVADAGDAYASLQSADRPLAVLLDYGNSGAGAPAARTIRVRASGDHAGAVRLGVIGAGAFFRSVHLPLIVAHQGFAIRAMGSRTGLKLRDLATRHSIPVITTEPEDILRDPDIDAVLIATRHNLHASLAQRALQAGKHVFVEKPLGLTTAECERVVEAVETSGRLLAVGFNRRFSPHAVKLKGAVLTRDPKIILYRVNAGSLPMEHWLRDPIEGGGRLVGEGVHFFDFMRWLTDSEPVEVRASAAARSGVSDVNNLSVSVTFRDGSLGVLTYVSDGHSGLGKERIEVFSSGRSLLLDDFRRLEAHGAPGRIDQRSRVTEKGHKEILDNFYRAIRGEESLGVTVQDGWWATWCAQDALRQIARSAQTVVV